MHYYKVFGYIFRCQHAIQQLYEITATDSYDVDIIIGEMPQEITCEVAQATIFPCISSKEQRFWMHNTYGILAVYKSGQIYAMSTSDRDTFYLLQFVLGYGIAMYAHLNNRIAIHCGSVAINQKCIMLAGDSGSGKSTLTHELISLGATMLSDDVVAIGYDENHIPCVYPAFPQQKLCRNAALQKGYNLDELLYVDPEKDKFAVLHTDCFSADPHHLHSFFYLECYEPDIETTESTELQITPIDGFDKVSVLVDNLYLNCILPNIGLSAEAFQLCVDLVKSCDIYRISRPLNKDTLSLIRQFILDTLQQ